VLEQDYPSRTPELKFLKERQMNDDPKKESHELKEDELKQVTGGAVEIFLKIDGVEGESLDTVHKKEID
jgi:bacteriocin-like protein